MLFSSLLFIYIFLPSLLLLYFIVKGNAARRAVLLIFSLVFYAWGEPVYILLMVGVVLANYIFGRMMTAASSYKTRRLYVILSVIVNLCPLFVYKYFAFLAETVSGLFRFSLAVPDISLPLGISFFTFQAMTYTIDVYRGKVKCQRSFTKLLLYITFFPQLVAGPIVRYADIEMQLENRKLDFGEINNGLLRFAAGMAKKVLIANSCGKAVGAMLDVDPSRTSVAGTWTGILFFAMQIYFDFSGYSDMAIGLGQIFGFKFLENFNYPYVSRSVTEFWRRWHMSLGSFFRDYVYIPMGGNRRMWLRNIIVVWGLTGLWHGASWNFPIWGLYYAAFLILEKKVLLRLFDKMPKALSVPLQYVYMTVVTLCGWALFYFAGNTAEGFGRLFGVGVSVTDLFTSTLIYDYLVLLIVAIVFSMPVVPAVKGLLGKRLNGIPAAVISAGKTALTASLLALATVMLAGSSYNPFLYFRF